MGIEQNKALIRRFTDEVWRCRNVAAIPQMIRDDYDDPEIPPPGRVNLPAFFERYFRLRPDFELTDEQLTAEDDRVVQYITGTFTNTEPHRGPVGQRMTMQEINIFWVCDQMISAHLGIGRSR